MGKGHGEVVLLSAKSSHPPMLRYCVPPPLRLPLLVLGDMNVVVSCRRSCLHNFGSFVSSPKLIIGLLRIGICGLNGEKLPT